MSKSSTKPKHVSYTRVPGKLWNKIKKHLPKSSGADVDDRLQQPSVLDGIWYVL